MSLLLVFVILTFIVVWLVAKRRPHKLPPTVPGGFPIVGNLLQALPISHLKLDLWKVQCGPVYTLDLAGKKIVVLANAQVACDVLDKMSALCSDRPRLIMFSELMCRGLELPASAYNETWKRHRRGAHEVLNVRAAEDFYSTQEDEAVHLAYGLAFGESKGDLFRHATRASASAVWRAIYGGSPLLLHGSPELDTANDINARNMAAAKPPGPLVDIFPALLYLPKPLAPFKGYADWFYDYATDFFRTVATDALRRRTVSDDTTHLNLTASLTDRKEKLGLSDDDIAWLTGTLYLAGAETTATVLQWFVLAMVLHPEVVRKAHEELDAVLDGGRPTFADGDRLPYISAIVKEALRWRPATALGVPHCATKDIVYGDYVIPTGTMLIGLIWSICRDPQLFPDPDVFKPERFLDEHGQPLSRQSGTGERLDDFVFGFGRRICVGRDVALNTLYIDIAMLLWAFDFRRVKDEKGEDVVPSSTEFHDSGVTVRPLPFPFDLCLRNKVASDFIEKHGKGIV